MAPVEHDLSYYLKCMIGGGMACGLTHAGITPVDLVKCRRQVSPELYKSMIGGVQKIGADEGIRGLTLGFGPTLIGYSLQGLGKFGFYELFKDVNAKILGQETFNRNRKVCWAISSACAEVIADTLLCPWEALKVKMQTSKPGVYPVDMVPAFNKLKAEEGTQGMFKALVPLWCRQVPYTVVKFVAFEYIVEKMYEKIFNSKPKSEYSKGTQLGITFASGYLAGIFCAIVSHPADTMVSKLNNVKEDAGSVVANVKNIYAEIGMNGLWRGLGTRIFMIGTLTGFQWWIYDTFKSTMGLGTTGGSVPTPVKKN